MDVSPFLSGQLLLSMPGMGDARFERAVIAMCLHDEEGALGLICNAPMPELSVADLMRQLDIDPGVTPDVPVLAGGPVEPGRGFVLHSAEYEGQGTISIGKKWGLTSTLDILKDIAAGKGPARWLATVGYAGWGAGQLEEEMTQHGWLAAPGDEGILFETPLEKRWPAAFAGVGLNVGRMSAVAGRA